MSEASIPKAGPQPVQEPDPDSPKAKRPRPTRMLPTDRIKVTKHFEMVRAVAVVSGPTGRPASNKEVADAVGLSESTALLVYPFLMDIRLIQRVEGGGYVPSAEAAAYARALDWKSENAAHKLAPAFNAAWFGEALLPRLSMRPMEEAKAVEILAEQSSAGPDYAGQLKVLIEMLITVGQIEREGTMLSRTGPVAVTQDSVTALQEQKEPKTGAVATSFLQAAEGAVQFHVSVNVSMKDFSGWKPDRIASFFAGIAQVLAAKGQIEKDSAEG